MSVCRSCDQPIRWVKMSLSGKKMPIDPRPHAAGNLKLLALTEGDLPLAAYIRSDDVAPTPPGQRYRSHFSTCPHAASHRTAS